MVISILIENLSSTNLWFVYYHLCINMFMCYIKSCQCSLKLYREWWVRVQVQQSWPCIDNCWSPTLGLLYLRAYFCKCLQFSIMKCFCKKKKKSDHNITVQKPPQAFVAPSESKSRWADGQPGPSWSGHPGTPWNLTLHHTLTHFHTTLTSSSLLAHDQGILPFQGLCTSCSLCIKCSSVRFSMACVG